MWQNINSTSFVVKSLPHPRSCPLTISLLTTGEGAESAEWFLLPRSLLPYHISSILISNEWHMMLVLPLRSKDSQSIHERSLLKTILGSCSCRITQSSLFLPKPQGSCVQSHLEPSQHWHVSQLLCRLEHYPVAPRFTDTRFNLQFRQRFRSWHYVVFEISLHVHSSEWKQSRNLGS